MDWRALTGGWWPSLAALAVCGALAAGASGGLAAGAPFEPESVSFVSLAQGWALGTAPCVTGRCLGLRETIDRGRVWTARPLPAALLALSDRRFASLEAPATALSVRFADARDGWIYGGVPFSYRQSNFAFYGLRPILWSTHDGGAHWAPQLASDLPHGDSIYDLEAAGGSAYLMRATGVGQVTVEHTPAGRDEWTFMATPPLHGPAGGAQPTGQFVFAGGAGWLVEGNDRGTDGSARLDGGHWVTWTPPCASVGDSFAIPAASSATSLAAVCVIGGYVSIPTAQAPPGAVAGSSWLYTSADGGLSFTAGPEIARQDAGDPAAGGGPIASAAPQTVVLGRFEPPSGRSQMVATFDGGAHWSVVASGDPLFIGFTSPTQGVAILSAHSGATSTSMLMTYDGGHHWSTVSF
ncbi:MAG: hypothetical protein ABSF58_13780 [Solirubrobacteraceae bacterium]|jgi:hypothetical protein